MLAATLLVGLGSALGGMARFLLTAGGEAAGLPTPWTTLAINAVGSFAIGALYAQADPASLRAQFVGIGILGGFTTFSAFSWQTLRLLQERQLATAAALIAASLALGLLGAWAGWAVARR